MTFPLAADRATGFVAAQAEALSPTALLWLVLGLVGLAGLGLLLVRATLDQRRVIRELDELERVIAHREGWG